MRPQTFIAPVKQVRSSCPSFLIYLSLSIFSYPSLLSSTYYKDRDLSMKWLFIMTMLFSLPFSAFAAPAKNPQEQIPTLRIISAANPLTQIVAALEQADLFVGLDRTSHTKAEYHAIPDVGYRIQLSTEGILSLNPDLVLLAHDSGPAITLEQLQHADVELLQFPELKDVASIQAAIETIAVKLHQDSKGTQLQATIAKEAQALAALSQSRERLTGFFILQGGSGQGSPQISGRNTTAANVLELLNIDNLFADDYANYRAVTLENQMQKRPDIVLLGHTGIFAIKQGESTKEMAPPPFQLRTEGLTGWPQALQPKCVFEVDMSHYLVFGIHIYADSLALQKAILQCLAES